MIESKILSIFNEVFSTAFNDVNIERNTVPQWDSVKHVELVLKIQEVFLIKFHAFEISEIKNLKELAQLTKRLLN